MPYVITQNCCNEASCVSVCPVDCIHPTPSSADYHKAEMLYIDPNVCIDCGACVDVCPVDAISRESHLTGEMARFIEVNSDYFETVGPIVSANVAIEPGIVRARKIDSASPALKVAIVGAGPAGYYTADALLESANVPIKIDMFDRLCTPGGLVRFGVAPDHPKTKKIQSKFAEVMADQRVRSFFNIEVGQNIQHSDLSNRYHAVVYAHGAHRGKRLGIAGEELANSASAADFVAWFNGHPDFAELNFDLSSECAVVIGNGNVALDVARILVTDPEILARTDIADHALNALRQSKVREVVVVSRRGPVDAAFTATELIGLMSTEGVDIVVEADQIIDPIPGADDSLGPTSLYARTLKLKLLRELASRQSTSERRIVLKFLSTPLEIVGVSAVEGVQLIRNESIVENGVTAVRPTDDIETISCGLVLRSVGYLGSPIAGLAFDEVRGVLPNLGGRVLDSVGGDPIAGIYAAGWIKRGPTGVIGTNKRCAVETVANLLEDFAQGRLDAPVDDMPDLASILPNHIGTAGAQAIDVREVEAGRESGRPRVKVVNLEEQLAIALSH
jgi:ferredoxin/flavodoxin---NADP+ reductase